MVTIFILLVTVCIIHFTKGQMDKSDKIKVLIKKTNNIEVVDLENVIGDNENNIFFIESNNNLTKFHPRLLCAFESAALHNPEEMV